MERDNFMKELRDSSVETIWDNLAEMLLTIFTAALVVFVIVQIIACCASEQVTEQVAKQHIEESVVVVFNNGGLGTGVFIDDRGTILTAYHVIADPSDLEIKMFRDVKRRKVTIIGASKALDLAVIRLVDELPTIPLGIADSEPPIGSTVTVIGHPLGYQFSTTKGVISNLCRAGFFERSISSTIQLDAPVNGGNSGGPAIVNNQIIGICSYGVPYHDGLSFFVSCEYIRLWLKDI